MQLISVQSMAVGTEQLEPSSWTAESWRGDRGMDSLFADKRVVNFLFVLYS